MTRRLLLLAFALSMSAVACGGTEVDISTIDPLPVVDADTVRADLVGDLPVVLNVWASWCIPCRSEAPLLDAAAAEFADRVRFVGLNVRDSQPDARRFIAEFLAEAPMDHLADPGGSIPAELGGNSVVPLTFFFRADGTLDELHIGVIDERTLAFHIDELLAGG